MAFKKWKFGAAADASLWRSTGTIGENWKNLSFIKYRVCIYLWDRHCAFLRNISIDLRIPIILVWNSEKKYAKFLLSSYSYQFFTHCALLSTEVNHQDIKISLHVADFFFFSKWRMALRSFNFGLPELPSVPSMHVFSGHFFLGCCLAACLFSGARVRWPQSGTYKEKCVQNRPTKLRMEIQKKKF